MFPARTASSLVLRFFAPLVALLCAPAAFASNITIASPVNGTTISSPMWVRAHNVGCNGLPPTAFGYSIDGSSTLIRGVNAFDVDLTNQGIGGGTHTLHFKSWTSAGICPVVSTTFNVGGGGSAPAPTNTSPAPASVSSSYGVPSYARASSDLDTAGNWAWEHDGGTPGSSHGSTSFPAYTGYDDSRQLYMTYSDHGGERWHLSWGRDASATHFVLDTYVYVVNPDQLANLELDINQVMGNGETVLLATQCSSYSHSWEWTYQSGNRPHWHNSNIYCNPKGWSAKTWHHIQIGMHRDNNGYVVHDWVNFDGGHSTFSGAAGSAGLWLGWASGSLTSNVQLDGANWGSGSVNAYIHKLTVYRW